MVGLLLTPPLLLIILPLGAHLQLLASSLYCHVMADANILPLKRKIIETARLDLKMIKNCKICQYYAQQDRWFFFKASVTIFFKKSGKGGFGQCQANFGNARILRDYDTVTPPLKCALFSWPLRPTPGHFSLGSNSASCLCSARHPTLSRFSSLHIFFVPNFSNNPKRLIWKCTGSDRWTPARGDTTASIGVSKGC